MFARVPTGFSPDWAARPDQRPVGFHRGGPRCTPHVRGAPASPPGPRSRRAGTLLADFMAEISLSIVESRTESLRQLGRPARSLEQHRQVAEAVRSVDTDGAARAMHIHI